MRKLFVDNLIRENAGAKDGGTGLPFRALIPPQYAGEGQVFASSLCALLPSLKLLEEKGRKHRGPGEDDEDRDFALLTRLYEDFLERLGLFEPAWEKPPLRDRDHEYHIFFPEAIEDFAEYEALLGAEPNMHFVWCPKDQEPDGLLCFSSVRAELRSLALEIRRLHEEDSVPYEEMAVSVPGLEAAEPWLVRELTLYHIPFQRRRGRPLGEYGAGKIFSLIQNCHSENFSFGALKALLLNDAIPWTDPDANRELIEFGIKNNCVSGFTENGIAVDVWAEAFKENRRHRTGKYYEKLKARINALCLARNFSGIRKQYFAFRGAGWETGDPGEKEPFPSGFLSRNGERCSPEADAVLGRSLEELAALIQLEEDYREEFRDFPPGGHYRFYCSILNEKQYVLRGDAGGVNIFPYRVAAAAPFACHFVLNAVQREAAVLYQPLNFLRPDKRNALGIKDTDASEVFFRLYRGTLHTRISVSEENFSGSAIPHSFFAGRTKEASPLREDPYLEEKLWWARGGPQSGGAAGGAEAPLNAAAFPRRLFPLQRQGYDSWRLLLAESGGAAGQGLNMLKDSFAQSLGGTLLERRIEGIQKEGGAVKVSATDLNDFFPCPVYFFLKKLLDLEPFSLEAKLLDDASRGSLYHEILYRLFVRIRDEDGSFNPARRGSYCLWVQQYAEEAAKGSPDFRGPLAAPILASQSGALAKKIMTLLLTEEKYFPLYSVGGLEETLEYAEDGMILKGRLDRVSLDPEGKIFIIDYKSSKSGKIPLTKKASTESPGQGLRNFQIPMYIRLYEKTKAAPVEGACFMIIASHEVISVTGKPGNTRGHSREEYQETLDALERYTRIFRDRLKAMNFVPSALDLKDCMDCEYRTVCRTSFFLNAAPAERGRGRRDDP
jgi:RecB family exonuclease